MNIVRRIWAMRVTSHVALKEISNLLSIDAIEYTIEFLDIQLKKAGKDGAKIAVSGLNPHNGENGLFGTEEQDCIKPAIKRAQEKNINTHGPYPSDLLFLRLEKEHIDAIVCMYHDQAQIGLKFDKGLTLHAGLPSLYVRQHMALLLILLEKILHLHLLVNMHYQYLSLLWIVYEYFYDTPQLEHIGIAAKDTRTLASGIAIYLHYRLYINQILNLPFFSRAA